MLITVNLETLESAINAKLVDSGAEPVDARLIAQHLIFAEERGYSSHGLQRLPAILKSLSTPSTSGQAEESIRDVAATAREYNANGQMGIVAMTRATDLACELAKNHGVGLVGAKGYRGTTGMLGFYVNRAAEQGIVCIAICHSEYAVAPTGGRKAILGTNPIAIGFPGKPYPFVADIATSAWSYGDLVRAMREGRTVPEGVVQAEDGRPSTDPNDADNGSQSPMAGHKGYALGLAIELLCGPLLGAKAGREAVKGSDAAVLIAITEDLFRASSDVESDASALFSELQTSPLAPGSSEIRIPGHRSAAIQAAKVKENRMEIDDGPLVAAGISLG